MANYYQILGIPNFSSAPVVKKNFRRLAIQYHPDKHKGRKDFEEKFKEINRAYQVLNNPQKKSFYDQRLSYELTQPSPITYQPQKPAFTQTKQENPYRVKREKVAYSPFQVVFIKVALLLVLVFAAIAVGVNLTNDSTSWAAAELDKRYQTKKNTIEVEIEAYRFHSALKNLDTLALLHGSNPDDEFLKKKLLFYFQGQLETNYPNLSKHQAIDQIKEFKRLSLLFKQEFPSSWKLELLTNQLKDTTKSVQRSLVNQFNTASLKLTEKCKLTDILLANGLKDEAFQLIEANTQTIFKAFYNQLGIGYYERLKEVEVQADVFGELVQFCFVNARTHNEPYESLQDWLFFKLEPNWQKQTFKKLRENNFGAESLLDMSTTDLEKKFIQSYQLSFFLEP